MHRSLVASTLSVAATAAALNLCVFAASTTTSKPSSSRQPDLFATSVQPFIQKNCISCHNDKAKVGGLSLAGPHSRADVLRNRDQWELISTRIKNGEMPPKGAPRPAESDAAAVTSFLDRTFDELDRSLPPDPGRLTAHRLNRFEYNNAIKDLLGIDFHPADDFPADDSGYGFDNIGDVLSISPVLMEKYLAAAEKIARKAIPTGVLPKPTRERLPSDHAHGKYPPVPIGQWVRYQFNNEANYTIRAGVSGKRQPLFLSLFIDNVDVKDTVFDGTDDEAPRYIEYKTHLTAGEHRIGARLRRTAAVAPLPKPPDLRFLTTKSKQKNSEPPPPTPSVDYLEIRGPYDPLPAPPNEAQKRILICDEKTDGCAAHILRTFAEQAWRRPVAEKEIAKLTSFVSMAQSNGDSFDQGMRLALEAVLVSPDFLFRIERDPDSHNSSHAHAVSDLELASRLSFFLWSSIPDSELLRAAQAKTLHQPAVLHAQVTRMLKDPRSERFVENFAGQWLQLRNLDSIKPDPDKFPEFALLRNDMHSETRLFFEALLRENRSILDFIDGKYSYVNDNLAAFYRIPGVKGNEFRRVSLDGTQRSGVLTQASVLTVSSYPTRTSPVIRGKWVLENFLNAPPPPPPPNVPTLDDKEIGAKLSMREQLQKHRANPVCASCHSKMDPIGFGLENYNAIGQWRTADGKFAIDASGTLPSGKTFDGPAQLKEILRSNPRAFAQCVTEKMLTYALGRGLERFDRPAVNTIVDRLAENNYRISVLISGIVESLPFRMRRGEGESNVTQTLAQASRP